MTYLPISDSFGFAICGLTDRRRSLMFRTNYFLVCFQDCRSPRTWEVSKQLLFKNEKKKAVFGSLLATEYEGEYARNTSGQDFANFDVRTKEENANLRSEESGSY